MIKALIIDDEQHCIDALSNDLETHCTNVEIAGTCASAKDGILSIKKLQPQLVFLDVDMPWMNGFEMLEALPEINFGVIFTTAYDQFAARAFRISAIDYLLKPVDAADLVMAVNKAEERMIKDFGLHNIQNLLHNIRHPLQHQKVALPISDGYEFAETNSILFCTAEGAYTRVNFKDKKPLLISRTLGDVGEMLPSELFIRIHHSTLVNLNEITHYSRTDGGYVVISSNEKLAVSKAKKEMLMQQLGLR